MRTLAAILVETGKPLVLDEIEIPPLKPGQVLVEIQYSGICHTQLLEVRGFRGKDPFLPHCLGHEGSGIVREVGAYVKKVKPGDRAILSWMKGSGANIPGTLYKWKDRTVNAGAITTFSQYSIISENRITPIPDYLPLKEAALFGCALPTGLGTVFNTARPNPGQSIAIFGCGGVGLFAIQGAAIAGCVPIIAIDLLPDKLKLAQKMGAHYIINAKETDPISEIQKICPSLDFAIEASGSLVAMKQSLKSVRNQGGAAVIIGNARAGMEVSLDPKEFNMGKRLLGTWGGDNNPDVHFPRYCNFSQHGHLNLSPFLSKSYSLQEIDVAFDNLERGSVLRPLINLTTK